MNEADFLRLLTSMRFAERYWSLCEAFDSCEIKRSMTKAEIKNAFASTGLKVRYYGRIAVIKMGIVAGWTWEAKAVPKRTGAFELSIYGEGEEGGFGGNFQGLAYESKQLDALGFTRYPPYPMPDPDGDVGALNVIIVEFAAILAEIKLALQTSTDMRG